MLPLAVAFVYGRLFLKFLGRIVIGQRNKDLMMRASRGLRFRLHQSLFISTLNRREV